MLGKMLLISIKPKYAELIFDGKKTVELRRVCPKVNKGDLVLIYISSPTKAICGGFNVDSIIKESPKKLWDLVGSYSGINKNDFDKYFINVDIGYGITFSEVWSLEKPIKLEKIKSEWPEFHPPQSYRYLESGGLYTDVLCKMSLNI
ncbi:MAG: EVE domain-containing protein [Crenarchaeota archaeon]|nr:EVE domain-containing protein [Thermoproteota archaeon]